MESWLVSCNPTENKLKSQVHPVKRIRARGYVISIKDWIAAMSSVHSLMQSVGNNKDIYIDGWQPWKPQSPVADNTSTAASLTRVRDVTPEEVSSTQKIGPTLHVKVPPDQVMTKVETDTSSIRAAKRTPCPTKRVDERFVKANLSSADHLDRVSTTPENFNLSPPLPSPPHSFLYTLHSDDHPMRKL